MVRAENAIKHTPGPWYVFGKSQDGGLAIVGVMGTRAGYRLRAEISGNRDELNANARLIAAAPDLLQRSKELIEAIADMNDIAADVRLDIYIQPLLDAIAKAEGRQP